MNRLFLSVLCVIGFAFAVSGFAACGGDGGDDGPGDEFCNGSNCVCPATEVCDVGCPADSTCNVSCLPGSDCSASCAGVTTCNVECADSTRCDVDCAGESCDITCPATGCTVTGCGAACTVSCGISGLPTRTGDTATCP